jgi:hypothetical protein
MKWKRRHNAGAFTVGRGNVYVRNACEKYCSRIGVGSNRVPYLDGFIDASCSHISTHLSIFVLFQLKKLFMVTFQAKAPFVLR